MGASRWRGTRRTGADAAGEYRAGRRAGSHSRRPPQPKARGGDRGVRRRARQSGRGWPGQIGQAVWRADLLEGSRFRAEGPHAGFRIGVHQGHARRRDRPGGRELPARRSGAARPFHHARVRHDLRHHDQLPRRGQGDPQPMEPAAHARWIVRWIGGCCRCRHCAAFDVLGRRRIDAHPGIVLRVGRAEGVARARAAAAGAQRIRHTHQYRRRGLPNCARYRRGL